VVQPQAVLLVLLAVLVVAAAVTLIRLTLVKKAQAH
jgi:hypothetical protein